jgi:hypothetical protein
MMNHLKILEVLPPYKEIIITLFPLFILQCPPFARSLDLNCFSSHLLLLPCCPLSLVHLPWVFLLLEELSMYWIIAPLQSAWNYLSNEWSFISIGHRTRELRPFHFVGASCPGLISERVTSKDLVLTSCTGLLKCWFLRHWKVDLMEHFNIQFPLLYISEHVSRFWRCWWSWFQLLLRNHWSDSPCLQNNYNAQSTPEVTVGNTNPMPTNNDIPKIFTCGIVNLAKILMGVRECKRACKR